MSNLYVNNLSSNCSTLTNLCVTSNFNINNSMVFTNITTSALTITNLTTPSGTITNLTTTNVTTSALVLISGPVQYSNRPFGLIFGRVAQSIPHGGWEKLTSYWDGTVTAANMSLASGVFTIAVPAKYYITTSVVFATSTTGVRGLYISVNNNGAGYGLATIKPIAGKGTGLATAYVIDLVANDTVEIYVYQNTGSALAMDTVNCGTISICAA